MLSRDRLATARGVHDTSHGRTYNELVIDTRPYAQALPDSLAGFFVLPKSSGEQRRVAKDQHV